MSDLTREQVIRMRACLPLATDSIQARFDFGLLCDSWLAMEADLQEAAAREAALCDALDIHGDSKLCDIQQPNFSSVSDAAKQLLADAEAHRFCHIRISDIEAQTRRELELIVAPYLARAEAAEAREEKCDARRCCICHANREGIVDNLVATEGA